MSEENKNAFGEEYDPDIVTVTGEDGKEYQFEILDAIETDDGRFLALLPVPEDPQEYLEEDGEVIPVQVIEDENGTTFAPIEDDELMDEIAEIFEERLADLFEENEEE